MKRYIVFIAFLMACLCAYSDHSVMSNNPVAKNQSTRSSDEDPPTVWLEDVYPDRGPGFIVVSAGRECVIRATIRLLYPTSENDTFVRIYRDGEYDDEDEFWVHDGVDIEYPFTPARGQTLIVIEVTDRDGNVYLFDFLYVVI